MVELLNLAVAKQTMTMTKNRIAQVEYLAQVSNVGVVRELRSTLFSAGEIGAKGLPRWFLAGIPFEPSRD